MKDLSITSTLGSKIKATLHDILCNISGYDIVLISDVGSWGDTLSDHQVFDDIKFWIQTIASERKQAEISKTVHEITYQSDHPNTQIARLLIIVFELLSPKIHIPQVALKVWIDGGEKKLVLNLLDQFLQDTLCELSNVLTNPEKLKLQLDTPEHLKYLHNFYTERRNRRVMTVS